MSIESWKAEFFPKDVHQVPADRAAEASLLKWNGLKEENLKKHELRAIDDADHGCGIMDRKGGLLEIGGRTCHLCHSSKTDFHTDCEKCVLYEVRNDTPCTAATLEERVSPWYYWLGRFDPLPMIKDLEKATELEKARRDELSEPMPATPPARSEDQPRRSGPDLVSGFDCLG